MKLRIALFTLLAILIVVLVACHNSDSGNDGVNSSVNDKMAKMTELAKKVDGKFSKLTKEQKADVIKFFGTEGTAKAEFKSMAHPPNEKYLKKNQ